MRPPKENDGRSEKRPTRVSRRSLLAGTAGALMFQRSPIGRASQEPRRPAVPEDTTKLQGHPPTELGRRSPFETPTRLVRVNEPSSSSRTPLQYLDGIITPSDLHFERHHAGVPALDPQRYKLLIHGMVERPMVFTLEDLKRFPKRSRVCFLECSGNGGSSYLDAEVKKELTPQQIDGLTSTSDWMGVPLALLFREVGIKDGAMWFLAESQDGARMSRSIPVSKAWDDAMIALAQNGEPLRPEQGYPARLLLPGWEGNSQVKWIRRIEVADRPFMTREETSKYTDPLADCTARIFSFVMDAKSIITFPAYPETLEDKGWYELSGIAWTGRGKITRVEISTDGGRRWEDAELQEPVLPKCHTRFRKLWKWNGGGAVLMSRATDETGYVQPTLKQLRAARGAGTRYHFNQIRAWRVERDGRAFFEQT